MKDRKTQRRPRYRKTFPSYLIYVPFVDTSGGPACPYEYNNGLHAALHSILAAMQCDTIDNVRAWTQTAQWQITRANKALRKPNAAVVPEKQNAQISGGTPSAEADC